MKPTPQQILSALNKIISENKTKLKTEKVELGEIDDLRKFISNAEQKLKTANNFSKSHQKETKGYDTILEKQEDLEIKKEKSVKELNNITKAYQKIKKEIKADLTKAKKSAKTITKQLKDLGLDAGVMKTENNQIQKIQDKLDDLFIDKN